MSYNTGTRLVAVSGVQVRTHLAQVYIFFAARTAFAFSAKRDCRVGGGVVVSGCARCDLFVCQKLGSVINIHLAGLRPAAGAVLRDLEENAAIEAAGYGFYRFWQANLFLFASVAQCIVTPQWIKLKIKYIARRLRYLRACPSSFLSRRTVVGLLWWLGLLERWREYGVQESVAHFLGMRKNTSPTRTQK
jgi:hypothetical protein